MEAANRHRQRTGRNAVFFAANAMFYRTLCVGLGGGMKQVAGAVRTLKRGQLRFLVTPESLRNAMMEQALETGKQQRDVFRGAGNWLGEAALALLQPFMGETMAKRYTHICVFPTIARSNRYQPGAFCPAVPKQHLAELVRLTFDVILSARL